MMNCKKMIAGICAVTLAASMSSAVMASADVSAEFSDAVTVGDFADEKVTFEEKYACTSNSITLAWNAFDGADGYELYRYDPASGTWNKVAKTAELSYEDTELLSGKAYKYYVVAYAKESGKTVYSKNSKVMYVTTKPDTVKFTVTTKKKGQAVIKWKKVRGATSYVIYYKKNSKDSWQKIKTVGADVRSFTKKGLAGNYHGRIAVRAVKEFKGKNFNGKLAKAKIYKYPYAAKWMTNKNKWTLKSAFKSSVIPHENPNNVLPEDGDVPMEFYAKFGFTHGYGHCFVMASMFTEMARTMGYDATQVWGYVATANHGQAIHSWTEVYKDGKTYVCDSSFQGHYPNLNGFMFKYGTKNTWVYTVEGPVATNDD